MKKKDHKILAQDKTKLQKRLEPKAWADQAEPMFQAVNLHYEMSEKSRALGFGGIGAMHTMVTHLGLDQAINENLSLLKVHVPYFESDHVLNIAVNSLCEGTCLEDIELRRGDEAFLDALGAERIPDPTTAGDFCRRFRTDADVRSLQDAIDEARLNVWKEQPPSFFEKAVIDMDGTFAITTGECKQGMDISYKGEWGYHPLVVSLANTKEVLSLVNRPGNRPSHEGAAAEADRAAALCRRAGFRKSSSAATPTSARPNTSTAGTPRGSRSTSATTACRTSWRSPKASRNRRGDG